MILVYRNFPYPDTIDLDFCLPKVAGWDQDVAKFLVSRCRSHPNLDKPGSKAQCLITVFMGPNLSKHETHEIAVDDF